MVAGVSDNEFHDFCDNSMPARITEVEEQGIEGEASRLLLHIEGLTDANPNATQWDAAYHIARRFGLDPGKTRWEPKGTDERGRHLGAFVFERLLAASN